MVAVDVVALVMTGVGGLTVSVKVLLPVPPEFVALKFTEDVPTVVGVPDITPVFALMLIPVGSPIAL